MDSAIQDLRLALLRLRARPGHSATVATILALGIGSITAIFSLVDATLFHPFDLPQGERLVKIDAVDSPAERADPKNHSNSSFPTYGDYRSEISLFSGLAAYSDSVALHLTEGDAQPTRVLGALVTGNYFEVLGARPTYGRTLNAADDVTRGGHPVAVISEGLSLSIFGGPNPVGRALKINGVPFTVVGAMSPDFTGVSLDSRPVVWLPMSMQAAATPEWGGVGLSGRKISPLDDRHFSWLDIVGRLAPGVTVESAQLRLDALAKHRADSTPYGKDEPYPALVPAKDAAIDFGGPNETKRLSWVLLGLVSLLLLLASADAASLQLAHGDARRVEMATRAALGASRAKLVRQLFAESAITGVFAMGLGVMFAVVIRQVLIATMPDGFAIPMSAVVPVIAIRPLLFASAAAFGASVLFGLAPAFRGARTDLVSSLRAATTSGAPRSRLRDSLVVAQVALSTVLLVGAGLLLHSLERAASTQPGFVADNALIARMDIARQGYTDATGPWFYDQVLREARALPGVVDAALATHVPVYRSGMRVTIKVPGYVPKKDERLNVDYSIVSPGLFKTLGVALSSGRDFNESDVKAGALVAIVNRELARKYFGGKDPVGQVLDDLGPSGQPVQIVGVAPDMKLRTLRETPRPAVYVPLTQNYISRMALVIRTKPSPSSLIAPLRGAVAKLDRDLPLFGVTTLSDQLGAAMDQEKSMALLLSAFGILAVALAATGLGALVYHQAQSRQREFGVRLALGARPRAVLNMVLARGARLSLGGAILGLGGSLLLAPLVQAFLFEVTPRDPLTFAGVLALLAIVSLAAAVLPALKASRTDPASVLRSE